MRLRRALTTAGAAVIAAAGTLAVQAPGVQASAPAPRPVYAPGQEAADPGIVRDGNDYYAFMTGGLARVAHANTPQGPWVRMPDALARWGEWASGQGAVWAPDAVHTPAGWVLYYAAQAKGFKGQRCIGTAVADRPAGPYQPAAKPLICPILDGEDPAADRPDQTAGVIDPSPFQTDDGKRYLLYKTQKTPGTLRMFPLSDDGLHGRAEISHELVRHADSIENPVMVQRGEYYVLFAAANWYDQCKYSTVWRRSTDLWSFADKEEHVLLDKGNSGLCGPGGADVVATGSGPSRIFLHGWVCSADNDPCRFDGLVQDPNRTRVVYAATLTWGADNATPFVPAFLPPVSWPPDTAPR
ncbi:glycoside hydrolase family 43 protein [Micromonospora sp. NPDC005299]|uniref:glycoside hydrolase family 43 protein n=1 Tax=Micromonospora sp. NPDC005299 TaxID=3364231 RepID=UPI0036B2C25F